MGLMQKLTSVLVASSIVLSLVGTALAADTPALSGQSACDRMLALKVLKGKSADNACALGDEISRAELVTVIVRAFGQGENAALLNGSAAFPDAATHWASGNIAMAKNLVEAAGGDPIGMPDGTFNPNGKLTPAQAIAFLMKFLGVKADPTKSWPSNYVDRAVELGIITAADRNALGPALNDNATRGLTFAILDRAFYNFDLGGGKTFYTKYVDTSKPELTLDVVEGTVVDPEVTIIGRVKGASEVTVGREKATLDADGKFSVTYKLPELTTYPIIVTARNMAGGRTEQSITYTRINGDAATVEAKLGDALLKAGATTDLTVTVKDKNGEAIKDAAFDVKVEGEIGTYASGKFTAAAKPATGKLTVTAANATPAVLEVAVVAGDLATVKVTGAATAKIGQAVTFAAKGYDAKDNEVALTNVTWSSSTGSVIGASTGEFVGTASSSVLVTAKSGGKEGTAIVQVFGDAKALAMDVPTGLVANGKDTKTVSVKVVDASGAVVGNDAAKVTLSLGAGSKLKLKDATGGDADTVTTPAVNGVAAFTVYQPSSVDNTGDFKASTASLSAIGGTLTGAVGTITSVAPTVGSVVLTTDPGAAVIDTATTSVNVNAKVLDTTGVQITAPAAFTVTLSNSSTTLSTLGSTTLYVDAGKKDANGAAMLALKGKEGDITLSGTTSAGYTVTPATFTTKNAGPAYQMVVVSAPKDTNADDLHFEMKVAVQDAAGTTKTNLPPGAVALTVTAKHETGNQVLGYSHDEHGVFTFLFFKAIGKAGTWTFTVSSNQGLIAPPAVTAKVTPGKVAQMGPLMVNGEWQPFNMAPTAMVADGAMTSVLSVELQDRFGNVVTGANAPVTFKKVIADGAPSSSGAATTGVDTTGVTVNAVNGVASVTITSTIAEGTDDFAVSAKNADGTPYGGSYHTASVSSYIVGAPARIEFFGWYFSDSLWQWRATAGRDFKVYFGILDGGGGGGGGHVVANDTGHAVTIDVIDISTNTVVKTLTARTERGVATATVNLTKAGTYTFKAAASINGGTQTASDDILVGPGAPAMVAVTPTVTGMEQDSTVFENINLLPKDAYGNGYDSAQYNISFNKDVNLLVNGTVREDIIQGSRPAEGKYTFTAPAKAVQAYTVTDSDGLVTVTVTDANSWGRAFVNPRCLMDYCAPGRATETVPVVGGTVTAYNAGPNYTLGVVKSPGSVTAGDDQVIQIGVFDGSGHLKTSENQLSITLEGDSSNPGEAWYDEVPVVNGVATFTHYETTAAGTYVYATYVGNDLLTVSDIKVVVKAGEPTMVVGPTINLEPNGSSMGLVKFRVTDTYGNTAPDFSGTMKFTADAGSSGATLLTTSAPIVNGVAVAQVQASTSTGRLTITPSIEGNTNIDTTGDSAKGFVVVGTPDEARSSLSYSADNSLAYVVLRDADGRPILGWKDYLRKVDSAGNPVADAMFTEIGSGVYSVSATPGVAIDVMNAGRTQRLFRFQLKTAEPSEANSNTAVSSPPMVNVILKDAGGTLVTGWADRLRKMSGSTPMGDIFTETSPGVYRVDGTFGSSIDVLDTTGTTVLFTLLYS